MNNDTFSHLIGKETENSKQASNRRQTRFVSMKLNKTQTKTQSELLNKESTIKQLNSIFSSQRLISKETKEHDELTKGRSSIMKILSSAINIQCKPKRKDSGLMSYSSTNKTYFNLNGRIYNKFKNIEDSISEDDSDYDYFDYIPKWYSVIQESKFKKCENILYNILLTASLFFYPLELILFNKNSGLVIFCHIAFEIMFFSHFIVNLLMGFKSKSLDNNRGINYKITSNLINYFKESTLISNICQLFLIFFNYPFIFLIKIIFRIDNFNPLRDSLIISKCLLFSFIYDWININSILKTNNALFFDKGSKNSFLNWSTLVDLLNGFKIFLFYIIFIHITSCIWIYIQYDQLLLKQDSWIYFYGFENKGYEDIYVASFYFNLTTLLTVGYGDIVPHSIVERIFV